jgi:TPP-dependent 2-oxoacid decarboxylase
MQVTQRLVTPNRYEFQMQYGSIGWSVGATLGYAQAAKDKRVIACIGDGSFQVRVLGRGCSVSSSDGGVPVQLRAHAFGSCGVVGGR